MSKSFTPEELNASGGWAFPCRHTPEHEPGMTLRDWFAGHSLVWAIPRDERRPEVIAKVAYEIADAMLARRGAVI